MIKNIGISGTPEEIKIIGTLLELEGFAKGRCREQECVYLVTYNSKMYDSFDTKDTSCGILDNKKEFKASEFDQAYQYLFDKELFTKIFFNKYHNKIAIQCNSQEEYNKIVQLYYLGIKNYWTEYKENTCLHISDNTYSRLEYFQKENYTIIPASFVLQFKVLQFKSEKMNKVKKIIGYKVKDEKYRIPIVNLAKAINPGATKEDYPDGSIMRVDIVSEYFKALGLLDTWFVPVYEQDEVVLNIGNPKQRVLINKDGVTCEGKTMDFEELEQIYRKNRYIGNSTKTGWIIEFSEIKIGCSKFSVEEFDQVWEASKKFKS